MNRSIVKTIIGGILFGAAVFFAPFFLIKVLLVFMLIGFIGRMFWWRGRGWHHPSHNLFAYADKVRNMSEAEYAEFKNKMDNNCRGYYHRGCCNRWDDSDGYTRPESKKENVETK